MRLAGMMAIVLSVAAVVCGASALAAGPGHRPVATIATKHISVRESIEANEVVSHKGNSLIDERGRGSGTFVCPVQLVVHISYTKGTIVMVCATHSWNVTCEGEVTYFTAGPVATFTGTLTIEHATGKYSHAQGRLHIEGSIIRKTDALSVTMSGLISD